MICLPRYPGSPASATSAASSSRSIPSSDAIKASTMHKHSQPTDSKSLTILFSHTPPSPARCVRIVMFLLDKFCDPSIVMVKEVRNIRRQVLPHGLTVITEQMEHIRSASIGIWLETGSRDETPQSNGISHFIEHMVFKGTKHRTAEEIHRHDDSLRR